MQEKEDFGGVGVAFREGKEVEVVMSDVEVLWVEREQVSAFQFFLNTDLHRYSARTLIPSSEKHGGTAEDSSSASDRRTGNFSTADIGMSPL